MTGPLLFTEFEEGLHDGCAVEGRHIHPEPWRKWWNALTPWQQRHVRERAKALGWDWEQVAVFEGVPRERQAA